MKTILLLALIGGACQSTDSQPERMRIAPDAMCVTLPDAQWPALDFHPSGAWVYRGQIIGYSEHEDSSCIIPPVAAYEIPAL